MANFRYSDDFFIFMSFVNLRLKFPVLGEPGLGHAGRAVHGGRGDLRRRRLHQVPGGHTQVGSVQLSCLLSSPSTGRHFDDSTNTEYLPYELNYCLQHLESYCLRSGGNQQDQRHLQTGLNFTFFTFVGRC